MGVIRGPLFKQMQSTKPKLAFGGISFARGGHPNFVLENEADEFKFHVPDRGNWQVLSRYFFKARVHVLIASLCTVLQFCRVAQGDYVLQRVFRLE